MIKKYLGYLLVGFLFCRPLSIEAQGKEAFENWNTQGKILFGWRLFQDDDNSETEDFNWSLYSRVETVYQEDSSKYVFRLQGRADDRDSSRSFVAFEDFYFSWHFGKEEEWKFLIGYKLFNWTATEAFHPSDVINSRNYDSDIENLEKIGEPTIELSRDFEDFLILVYLFPRFESPIFPGVQSRLGVGADLGDPVAVRGAERGNKWGAGWGMQIVTNLGSSDIAVHYLYHVDRNFPVVGTDDYRYNSVLGMYLPNNLEEFLARPVPYYFNVTQFGLTYTGVFSGIIFKVEGVTRSFEKDFKIYSAREFSLATPLDHHEFGVGLEYSFFYNSGQESTAVLEFGGILGVSFQERSRMSALQRDLLVGIRHVFNNVMGSEIFASSIIDLEQSHQQLYNISYSQRLSDYFKLKSGLRIYKARPQGDIPYGLEMLDGDHHIYINLSRFF